MAVNAWFIALNISKINILNTCIRSYINDRREGA